MSLLANDDSMAEAKNTLEALLKSHLGEFQSIISSPDRYSVHNFFETIFFDNDNDPAECESTWRDFVKTLCAIPDKFANTRRADVTWRFKEQLDDNELLTDAYPA
jgi:hypothetical protein